MKEHRQYSNLANLPLDGLGRYQKMKTYIIAISIVLSVVFYNVAAVAQSDDYISFRSIGLSGNHVQVEQAAAKADALWPNNVEKYCGCYDGLIVGVKLSAQQSGDLSQLEKLVTSVLEKTETKSLKIPHHASDMLLGVQKNAFRNLLGIAGFVNTAGEDRVRYAALAGSFLIRISKELIPNFKPKPVYRNVAPPIRSGPVVIGMNPDGIEDPVAREAYKKAIEENSLNAALNSRQRSLRQLIPNLKEQLTHFLKDTETQYPAFKDKAEKLLSDLPLIEGLPEAKSTSR